MVEIETILAGLNAEQRRAVEAVRGPVCILAGAGAGKTTTITRRIAYQVASGAFSRGEVLAVTFTDKAAKEMASRLAALGAGDVRAKTFHAEALGQYHRFARDERQVMASKVPALRSLVSRLPRPYCFVSARDVAGEVEWAKNRRISPSRYQEAIGDRKPPIASDLMATTYAEYERRKQRAKMLDFEDLLEETIQLLERDARAKEQVRNTYKAFTVDEYQDVNLLQQSLLDAWVGGRPDVCVVGDDYQSIFGFTGATPSYLIDFPDCHAGCQTFSLTLNYRSTEQVLSAANRLAPRLGGIAKQLRHVRDAGPQVTLRQFSTGGEEMDWAVERAKQLHSQGVAWEEMAILYRINARSEAFEEALSKAQVPYQVADSPFLRRPAAKAVFHQLRRSAGPEVAAAVEETVRAMGFTEESDPAADGQEATRLADLGRLLALARGYEGTGGVAGFLTDLTSRFTDEGAAEGVHLLTYHKAKGKEWEAVFLPRLDEKELPFALAASDERLAEERRLFYVGLTRAKRHLFVTTAQLREGERPPTRRPSRFFKEIDPTPVSEVGPRPGVVTSPRAEADGRQGKKALDLSPADAELMQAMKDWRRRVGAEKEIPAYIVFWDETLAAIATSRPATTEDLLKVKGVGPSKVESYGADLLDLVPSFGPQ